MDERDPRLEEREEFLRDKSHRLPDRWRALLGLIQPGLVQIGLIEMGLSNSLNGFSQLKQLPSGRIKDPSTGESCSIALQSVTNGLTRNHF
jgi:hypothetical protein